MTEKDFRQLLIPLWKNSETSDEDDEQEDGEEEPVQNLGDQSPLVNCHPIRTEKEYSMVNKKFTHDLAILVRGLTMLT